MPALTRFVLRHKALVTLFWVVVAAAGVMTISGTTHRMTNDFAMPGQAFKVDNQIASLYGNGGSQAPYLPVITGPAGQQVTDPAVTGGHRAGLRRVGPGDPRPADRGLRHHARSGVRHPRRPVHVRPGVYGAGRLASAGPASARPSSGP